MQNQKMKIFFAYIFFVFCSCANNNPQQKILQKFDSVNNSLKQLNDSIARANSIWFDSSISK